MLHRVYLTILCTVVINCNAVCKVNFKDILTPDKRSLKCTDGAKVSTAEHDKCGVKLSEQRFKTVDRVCYINGNEQELTQLTSTLEVCEAQIPNTFPKRSSSVHLKGDVECLRAAEYRSPCEHANLDEVDFWGRCEPEMPRQLPDRWQRRGATDTWNCTANAGDAERLRTVLCSAMRGTEHLAATFYHQLEIGEITLEAKKIPESFCWRSPEPKYKLECSSTSVKAKPPGGQPARGDKVLFAHFFTGHIPYATKVTLGLNERDQSFEKSCLVFVGIPTILGRHVVAMVHRFQLKCAADRPPPPNDFSPKQLFETVKTPKGIYITALTAKLIFAIIFIVILAKCAPISLSSVDDPDMYMVVYQKMMTKDRAREVQKKRIKNEMVFLLEQMYGCEKIDRKEFGIAEFDSDSEERPAPGTERSPLSQVPSPGLYVDR